MTSNPIHPGGPGQPYGQTPPPMGPPPFGPPPRRGRGALWFGIIMAVLFAGSAFVNLVLVASLFGGTLDGIVEEPISGVGNPETGKNKIAVIPLYGPIMGGSVDATYAVDPVAVLISKLEKAEEDEEVKAVVLEINSPGGGVTAFDKIHRAIVSFKERTGKPVIVSMGSVAASGGYYASVAGDYIFAEETTLTGSIGVVIPLYDVSGALEYLRIKDDPIVSGKNKAVGGTRAMTKDQRDLFQGIVDEAYELFLKRIQDGRGSRLVIDDRFRAEVADGRILTANQALVANLIDAIGGLDDAVQKARDEAGSPAATAVYYRREASFLETLQATVHAKTQTGPLDVRKTLHQLETPELLYLARK